MPNTIYSRPTMYKATLMRSRLEAAWAEQFDALGWSWQYEPICLAGEGGQYLPDFLVLIPGARRRVWFEVKGGWWEKPESYGLSADDDGYGDVYERTFDDRRRMSTLVGNHDPHGMFAIGAQCPNGQHAIELWAVGHKSFMCTWSAAIVECPHGCRSFATSTGTYCLVHAKPWTVVQLVDSLHGDAWPLRDLPRDSIVDHADVQLRGW